LNSKQNKNIYKDSISKIEMRGIERFVIGGAIILGAATVNYEMPYFAQYSSGIVYAGGITGGTTNETESEKKKKWTFRGKKRSDTEKDKIIDRFLDHLPDPITKYAAKIGKKICDKRAKEGKSCMTGSQ
jgi:hypothetical protein